MMKHSPSRKKMNPIRALAGTLIAAAALSIVGCASGPGFGVEQRGQTAKPPVKSSPENNTAAANPTQSQVQMLDEVTALKRELQRLQALVEEQQLRLDESERRNSEYYQQLQSQLDSQRAQVAQTVPAQPVGSGQQSNSAIGGSDNSETGQVNRGLNRQSVVETGQGTINSTVNNSVLTGTQTSPSQTNTSISTGNTGVDTQTSRADQIINAANANANATTTVQPNANANSATNSTTQPGAVDSEGESIIIGTTAGSIGETNVDPSQNQPAADPANPNDNLRVVTIPAANPDQPTTTVGRTLTRDSNNAGVVEQVPATQQAQRSYDAALELLKQSKFNEAIVAFEDMLALHGNSDLADDATFWVSEARYVSRDFAPALAGYQTVLQRFPSSERVPESLLKVGVIQAEMGATEEARQTYQQVMQRFPGSRVAVSAQSRLDKISN